MGLVIEPYDEIQVFIVGTGDCLWGRIQPESRFYRNKGALGGITLELTVEPLADTVHRLRAAGVWRLSPTSPRIGHKVHIPQRLVDTVFGDDRHFATHG